MAKNTMSSTISDIMKKNVVFKKVIGRDRKYMLYLDWHQGGLFIEK